jgi:hypothetical protein
LGKTNVSAVKRSAERPKLENSANIYPKGKGVDRKIFFRLLLYFSEWNFGLGFAGPCGNSQNPANYR